MLHNQAKGVNSKEILGSAVIESPGKLRRPPAREQGSSILCPVRSAGYMHLEQVPRVRAFNVTVLAAGLGLKVPQFPRVTT